jgi:4-amino-4-deoxy-L-arabinose transferase-like glycosyltransferase
VPFSPSPPGALGWRGPTSLAVAAACYLYGLGAIDLPSIGDEPLYLQIARVTAATGRWLPLTGEVGILDTKPPLLFWLGRAFGQGDWSLFRLRLPVVLLTFLTAGLVGWLSARLARDRSAGFTAALVFLGFRGTMQHGRPFLTNAGEVLFLFLPVVLLSGRRRTGPALAAACGLSLGAAALFKSFAVLVPGTVSLLLLLVRREGGLRPAWRRHGAFLASAGTLGLALFLLWPLLDPRPDLVLSEFVLHENGGKLDPSRFLPGLVAGPYPLWRIWLGPLLNAGVLAPPLVALGLDAWRRRRELSGEEAELWWWVLAFLVVYSIPTQRQENYVLPAGAALAALLGTRFLSLPHLYARLSLAVLGLLSLLAATVPILVAGPLGGQVHAPWVAPAALALGVAALAAAGFIESGRRALPVLAVLSLPIVTGILEPFSGPFPAEVAAAVSGRRVLAPDRFAQDQELLRFRLPGATLVRYACPAGPVACPPPVASGLPVVAFLDLGAPPPAGYSVAAEMPHLKARHTPEQLARLAAGDRSLLLERLVLLEPTGSGG